MRILFLRWRLAAFMISMAFHSFLQAAQNPLNVSHPSSHVTSEHIAGFSKAQSALVDASAGADKKIDYNKKYMTGDWDGWRPWLVDKGITVTSSFVTDILSNPVGGIRRGISHADSYGIDMTADLEKLLGFDGYTFFISFVVRGGSSLSATIGNQFPVQQDFGGQTYRLNELYVKKSRFEDHFHFKIGRLDAGNDFLQSPLYYKFVSNAFDGNPIGIFFNTTFSAYPVATWGAYMDVWVEKVKAKFAVYNANARVNDNGNHGFNFSFKNTSGALLISEVGYLLNQEKNDEGLPGNYRFGAFYATASKAKFLGGTNRGNWSVYTLLDQMLYREGKPGTDQGLTAFGTFFYFPENRNLLPFFTTSGLIYKGLFPGRDNDVTCIGLAYGAYSSYLRQAENLARKEGMLGPFGNIPQTYEAVIELNHWFQINDWFAITPDIQYICNPKGLGTIPNAFVFGAQIGASF